MKNKKVISNEYFYCEHLFERNDIIEELKKDFSIDHESGKGLEIYLKEHSWFDEIYNENRTYIVRDNKTDELVGYFSLKAGLFSIMEKTSLTLDGKTVEFETLPGIELAEFAINHKYISAHPRKKG